MGAFDGGGPGADDRVILGTAKGAAIPTFYRIVKSDPPTEPDFSMVYAIWDTASANLVGSYDTEGEALADVRDAVERFGRAYAHAWGLAIHDGDSVEKVAEGDELINRALDQAPAAR